MADISKLPKWARERIELLEMRLKEANEKIDNLGSTGVDPEGPSVHVGTRDNGMTPLIVMPHRTQVNYILSKDKRRRILVRSEADDAVYVNADDMISIHPQASNSVFIKFVR